MEFKIIPPDCKQGDTLLMGAQKLHGYPTVASELPANNLFLPVGTNLMETETGQAIFQICGCMMAPSPEDCQNSLRLPLLAALRDIQARALPMNIKTAKTGYSLAVITLSDKGAQGLRRDESGPLMANLVKDALPLCFCQNFLLPDNMEQLRALVAELALAQNYDMVFTTGGTGLSERDFSPQAIEPLLDIKLPGFTAAMLAESLKHTPNAIISRGVAGIAGKCLVIAFPGSKKGVRENLEAILPGLPHALKKLHGDTADCGA